MKLNQGLFTVYKGETVTITITRSEGLGAGQIVATRDPDDAKPTLIFPVVKDVGHEHFVDVVYGFTGAPPGSNYQITIDGDADDNEGPFKREVNTDSPQQPSPFRVYRFRVTAKGA